MIISFKHTCCCFSQFLAWEWLVFLIIYILQSPVSSDWAFFLNLLSKMWMGQKKVWKIFDIKPGTMASAALSHRKMKHETRNTKRNN